MQMNFRMLFRMACLSASIIFSTTALADVETFTEQERAKTDAMASSTERTCIDQLAKFQDSLKARRNSQPPESFNKLFSANYCPCIAQHVRSEVTLALVRRGTAADGAAFFKRTASECAAINLKAALPEICQSMAHDLPQSTRANNITQQQKDNACTCMQRSMDQVTGENLTAIASETIADYNRWRENPKLPFDFRPSSVLGSMMSCFKQEGLLR